MSGQARAELGIKHSFTKPYQPQTNGKSRTLYAVTLLTTTATARTAASAAYRPSQDSATQPVEKHPLGASNLEQVRVPCLGCRRQESRVALCVVSHDRDHPVQDI